MRDAVIVSAVRTPVGKAPRGTLKATRPDDLGAIAVKGALARVPTLDPKTIDDVIIGCAMPEGEQGMNIARMISFRAGLPNEPAAMTINRYCASGLQSISLAAERIRGGGAEIIVAGGAESMSYLPMGGNKITANPWLVETIPLLICRWASRPNAWRSIMGSPVRSLINSPMKVIRRLLRRLQLDILTMKLFRFLYLLRL